jgi:hypothetical protein
MDGRRETCRQERQEACLLKLCDWIASVWNKLLTKAIVQDFLENVIADALEGSEDK